MNSCLINDFKDFHDDKNEYKYKISDCDNITYGMNELHRPIKIVSIMEGGNNKKNCLFIILGLYIILFLIH